MLITLSVLVIFQLQVFPLLVTGSNFEFHATDSYPSNVWMNEAKTFRLSWKFIPAAETDSSHDLIEFAMQAKTTGWVGMGISPNGQMPNSDVVVGWVIDGKVFAEDRNTFGPIPRSQPKLDEHQNIQIMGGSESGGWTLIKFRRPFTACESDDLEIPVGTARVLFAFSPSNKDGPVLNFHGMGVEQKGRRTLNLRTTGHPIPPRPQNAMTFDFVMDRAHVMNKRTTYMCKLIRLPELASKHHAIEFAPKIMANNSGIVHHVTLFGCPSASNHIFAQVPTHTRVHECRSHPMMEVNFCQFAQTLAGWAAGGEPLSFPSHTGLPIGGSSTNVRRWVLLEIHYDNPALLTGVYDSSGMTMYYTPTLREFDLSMMLVGGDPTGEHSIFIPPKYPGTAVASFFSTSKCSSRAMAANGLEKVSIVISFLHAHTAAIAIKLRHIRNGIELPPIEDNPTYDFDFQQSTVLTQEVEFRAGDELLIECGYDTSDRTEMTYSGYSTMEEMCVAWLYVYPAMSWSMASMDFHNNVYSRYKPVNNTFVQLVGHVVTYFDPSTAVAREFYEDLWKGDSPRGLWCYGESKEVLTAPWGGNTTTQFFSGEFNGGPESPVFYPTIDVPYEEPMNNATCFVPPKPPKPTNPPKPPMTVVTCLEIEKGCGRRSSYRLSKQKILENTSLRQLLESVIKSSMIQFGQSGSGSTDLKVEIIGVNGWPVSGASALPKKRYRSRGGKKLELEVKLTTKTESVLSKIHNVLFHRRRKQFDKDLRKAIKNLFRNDNAFVMAWLDQRTGYGDTIRFRIAVVSAVVILLAAAVCGAFAMRFRRLSKGSGRDPHDGAGELDALLGIQTKAR